MPRHGNASVCCNDKTWDDWIGYASKGLTYAAAGVGMSSCTLAHLGEADETLHLLTLGSMGCEYFGSLLVKFGYKEGALGMSLMDGRTSESSNMRKAGLFVHFVGVCLAVGVLYEAGVFDGHLSSDPDSY